MTERSKRPLSRRLFVAAGCLTLVAGCGSEPSDPGRESYSEWDSAGVSVHATPALEAFAPLAWTVDPNPSLTLGEEGSPSGFFGSIQGIRLLADGHFLVLDGLQHDLRLFGAAGQELARAGGTGQGPGEFLGPALVPSVSRDSVVVFDMINLRLHTFAADLGAGRAIPVRGWDHGRVAPLGATGPLLLRDRVEYNGGGLEAAMTTEGPVRERRTWFWYDPVEDVELDIESTEAVRWVSHPAPDPNNRIAGLFTLSRIPLAPTPVAAVHAKGAYLASGMEYDIRDRTLEGELRRILRVAAAPDATRATMVEQDPRFDAETAPHTEPFIPSSLPTFAGLLVDDTGWVWAQLYDPDPATPARWVVFDESGRARGTVQTPAGLEVQSIGADRIYGIGRGPLGAEFVQVHRLNRATDVSMAPSTSHHLASPG